MGNYDDRKETDDIRLVEADSAVDAEKKYISFWHEQTVQYSHYYSVVEVEILEPIQ